MLAAGLIEMPPVSKVMPLPTRATFLAFFDVAAPVDEPDQPRRPRRALADADHAAVAGLVERLLVEHLDLQSDRLAQSLCALGEFGGEQVARWGVDEVAGGGHRGGDVGSADAAALAPFAVDSAVIFASPGSLGAVLALRKSVNRYAPRISPSTVASRSSSRQRGHHRLGARQRPRGHPGGAPDHVGGPFVARLAQPDRQHAGRPAARAPPPGWSVRPPPLAPSAFSATSSLADRLRVEERVRDDRRAGRRHR